MSVVHIKKTALGFIKKNIFRYFNFKKYMIFLRIFYYRSLGMSIHIKTNISKGYVNLPSSVIIGEGTTINRNFFIGYYGIKPIHNIYPITIGNRSFIGNDCSFDITSGITIKDDCMIAQGCKFIDHDHGTSLGTLMKLQKGDMSPIIIESDVWLGCNVVVLKGVKIGAGAVVAAGAVVTRNIPEYEIWGGVPAKKIRERRD